MFVYSALEKNPNPSGGQFKNKGEKSCGRVRKHPAGPELRVVIQLQ